MEQISALFTKAFKYVGPNLLMDILMFFGGKALKNVKEANKIEPVKEKTKIHHEQSKDTLAVGDATFMKKDDDFAINISKRKDIYQNGKYFVAGMLKDKDRIIPNMEKLGSFKLFVPGGNK